MRIGLTYNLKDKLSPDLPVDAFEEFDTEETIEALASALTGGGHQVFKLGFGWEVLERIRRDKIDFVFNIAEGIHGRNREAHLPALFELMGVPYSGSDPLTLSLTLDKAQAKMIVAQAGVLTPAFKVLGEDNKEETLPPFPLFVKPLYEGSSKGIRLNSLVETKKAFREQVSWLRAQYGEVPLLAESYISGREFTVGVLGNHDPYILGIMEIRLKDQGQANHPREFIYSLEVKQDWQKLCEYVVPAEMDQTLEAAVKKSALASYRALGCRDVARIDFRVDSKREVYFLEANPLPGLSPTYSDLVILARGMGWSYEKLILTILKHAQERYSTRESCK